MKLRHCKYTASTGGCSSINHPEMNQLDCMWNCGFYSNQTQVFLSLLILLGHGIEPNKIDYSMGFKRFKKDKDRDIYPDFYKTNFDEKIKLFKKVTLPDENKKQYGLYDFDYYNQIVNKFFNPSDLVLERKKYLLEKYNINPKETISVLYRGTDKYTEVRLSHPSAYLNAVKQLLEVTQFKTVLVQTDQYQVLDYFKSELGNIVVSFEETPTTSGQDAMNTVLENEGKDTMDWMQWFDAALRCVSDCSCVVNHTGNCALWMNLYRGNIQNVFQFDEFGQLT
jgi:hypothetical protein